MSGLVLYHIYLLCILRLCSIMCILSTNHHRSSWKCNSTLQYARSIQTAAAWLTTEHDYFISFFFFCCFDPSLILCYARVWIQLHSYFLSSLDGLQVGFLSKQNTNTRVILKETNKSSINASPSVSLPHAITTFFLGFLFGLNNNS